MDCTPCTERVSGDREPCPEPCEPMTAEEALDGIEQAALALDRLCAAKIINYGGYEVGDIYEHVTNVRATISALTEVARAAERYCGDPAYKSMMPATLNVQDLEAALANPIVRKRLEE